MISLTCLQCRSWGKNCHSCIDFQPSLAMKDLKFVKFEQTWLTPAEYEKRTKKKWNGAIWQRCKYDPRKYWYSRSYRDFLVEFPENQHSNFDICCALSPEPPPSDWKPRSEEQ